MLMDQNEQHTQDTKKIVQQLEKLILRSLLLALKELNCQYEPLKSVHTIKNYGEPPF
jgi:hypothetical protein